MKELDDIVARAIVALDGASPLERKVAIRCAIYKAIEFVLTMEPDAELLQLYAEKLRVVPAGEIVPIPILRVLKDHCRAMQAALLEELRNEARR